MSNRCGLSISQILIWANLHGSRFYSWKRNIDKKVKKSVPHKNFILPEVQDAIIKFKQKHPQVGYRKLTLMMVDQKVALISPASVLRILTKHGLNTTRRHHGGSKKTKGFM